MTSPTTRCEPAEADRGRVGLHLLRARHGEISAWQWRETPRQAWCGHYISMSAELSANFGYTYYAPIPDPEAVRALVEAARKLLDAQDNHPSIYHEDTDHRARAQRDLHAAMDATRTALASFPDRPAT